jgi:16S rRNA (uracil1498-N3)-methyltransferase
MRRLPFHPLPALGEEGRFDRDAAKHARVLRLRAGDEVELFDGIGRRVVATLVERGGELGFEVVRELAERPPLPPRELVLGLPKGPDLEAAVRVATELGATSIRLAVTERSVPRLEGGRDEKKLERLRRIALEASRQSERDRAPSIHPLAPLLEAASAVDRSLDRFVAAERAVAAGPRVTREGAAIVIGPEGGFTERELSALQALGFVPVSLGPTILRVSTAVAAALARLAA